jgi:anti-sigma factor RsiW
MNSFLDGEVDDRTRQEVGLHLAECADCAQLVEDDRFWKDTIRDYLDHELPDGLRASILGDLAAIKTDPAPGRRPGLDDLGWKQQLRVIWWAGRRGLTPRVVLQAAALAAFLIVALHYLDIFRSPDGPGDPTEPFGHSGPIVQVGEKADWRPGETVPTARLSLSGRLI